MYNFSKKWTVEGLMASRGKGSLPMLRVETWDEIAAAEAAGVDLISVPPNMLMDPKFRTVAPNAFSIPGDNFFEIGDTSEFIRWAFPLFKHGADAVYCSGSLKTIRALADHGIPVCGHVGLVPPKATWTGGAKAVGKTLDKAKRVWEQCKAHEEAGAFAVEIEVVPAEITAIIAEKTNLFLISMGGGWAGHAQYLFSDDVLGQNSGHVPRHGKQYADFNTEYATLQNKRITAMKTFADEVRSAAYPSEPYVVHATSEVSESFRDWLAKNSS
jgi:3-methyl-2-oxobutanoate hydroxymethyltransferase